MEFHGEEVRVGHVLASLKLMFVSLLEVPQDLTTTLKTETTISRMFNASISFGK
jgi:hypothetical protein